ncbi:MAG: autotransporter assembly complex protein TamA [Xanthomonadaceae bacterium]|jgi:translocation and assembly module TamA|nr:autotransporter assembly complex protein TamA [Xanthomonadaceae bacterium]
MRSPLFVFALNFLLLASFAAQARGTIDDVVIMGLDRSQDAEIIENIEVSLSLYSSLGKRQGESRLEYLLLQAERETRRALEPFGFYSPTITVDAPRQEGEEHFTVTIHVEKGEPVRVRNAQIVMNGPARYDRYLTQDLEEFRPNPGEVFDHSVYEDSKNRITQRLGERGYFDADFSVRQVLITRADYAADIDLGWDSGARYNMGPTAFQQDYFRPSLLNQLVYWKEGDYFHQGRLDRLRESLIKLDYFSVIDIQPRPEQATEDYRVPIDVNLTLARRSIYSAGLSYGSESGIGVRLGLERRYVNSRGHKLNSEIDYAQNRKQLFSQYRVPAFRWVDGWYGFALSAYDEQTDYIDMRNFRLTASRSGELNQRWTAIASINALRERWSYDINNSGYNRYEYATLIYPEISVDYVNVDDRMFPHRGISANAFVRGGTTSDSAFIQGWARMRWFQGLGSNSRMILRGEGGTTWTNELVGMPPSVRFFAGGDQSIRGYAWREVGPRTPPPDKFALGAKYLVTASAEFEHYFKGGPWGGAIFVDGGDAFDTTPNFRYGVGIGLRWRTLVGPVRIDIAHGLNNPDSQFQLYLNIGANL